MSETIKIKDRIVGKGYPTYIIAEMSANHAGSKERAKELIHAAKEAGADCVKIQTYTADTITIDSDKPCFMIEKGTWAGENLYKLYQKAYTPWEWQGELKEEADKIGIDFFSTPFDFTSVDFLEEIGMEFYKIASFELIDIPLIEKVAALQKPIIMSTGMASLSEIEDAVNAVRRMGNDQLALLKCTSAYPADCTKMNLNTIPNLAQTFNVPVGLSDHSFGYTCPALSVALGGSIIEKHFCISRDIENPDSSFSMDINEFKEMVTEVRKAQAALGEVHYGVTEAEMADYPNRRSLFVVEDIKAGEVLTPENIRSIRPGCGLAPKHYHEILGKVALCDLEKGTPLSFDVIGSK